MNDLEEQLSTALHERAAGITLDRDLLRPAVRRVRRRALVTRGASVAGGLGLAGAVAASGLVLARGPEPVPPAVSTQPQEHQLDIAFVTAKVRAALDDDDVVERVDIRATVDGVTDPLRVWFDPRTGASRSVDRDPGYEQGLRPADGRLIATGVDHAARTWQRQELRDLPEDRPGDIMGAPTPAEVRDLLDEDDSPWTLVGREDGTLHLRQVPAGSPSSSVDVWVDDSTYRPARMILVKEQKARIASTFTWLPRTGANLARTAVEVPDGYRRVDIRTEGSERLR